MAATTATILERTAVAAADANHVDLDVVANKLASAARRVLVLEGREVRPSTGAHSYGQYVSLGGGGKATH